jgi:GTP-binding protein HflX
VLLHVVDGSHPDPEELVRAVHEVLAGLEGKPGVELLVVNKIDASPEETLLRLKRRWPDAVFVSARSGAGLDHLRACIDTLLPRPAVELDVLVPYDRGDLVARLHERGEVLETDHTGAGTRLRVRVGETLAADLSPYVTARVA